MRNTETNTGHLHKIVQLECERFHRSGGARSARRYGYAEIMICRIEIIQPPSVCAVSRRSDPGRGYAIVRGVAVESNEVVGIIRRRPDIDGAPCGTSSSNRGMHCRATDHRKNKRAS